MMNEKRVVYVLGMLLALGGWGIAGAYAVDPIPPVCPEDALLSHPGSTTNVGGTGFHALTSDLTPYPPPDHDRAFLAFKQFTVDEPVCKLRWWGLNAWHLWPDSYPEEYGNCDKGAAEKFTIRFYQDADTNGEPDYPGAAAHEYIDVPFTKVDTGYDWEVSTYNPSGPNPTFYLDLYEYEAQLPACCPMLDGWLSIQGDTETPEPRGWQTDCLFKWTRTTAGGGDCGESMGYFPYTGGHRLVDLCFDLNVCLSPGGLGACCYPDETCGEVTQDACEVPGGGVFQGEGTICDEVDCSRPDGACCFEDGSCINTTGYMCVVAGGEYQGDGVACDPDPCGPPPTGACCCPDDCIEEMDEATCVAIDGGPASGNCCVLHAGTGCEDAVCEASVCSYDPYCCDSFWDGICASEAATDPNCDCEDFAGCAYAGDGTVCGGDCNSDGVPDTCDVLGGMDDCNSNWIPDDCEFIPADHNCCEVSSNGGCNDAEIEACVCALAPYCCEVEWDGHCVEIVSYSGCGVCVLNDCNLNKVLDECDIAAGTSNDCQPNGVPDECDIAAGTSPDFNTNGVPDECEGGGGGGGGFTPECTDDEDCDDGLFCNGAETCVDDECEDGEGPCADDEICDEENDRCVDCLTDADCDDGLFCNGAEVCVDGECQDGPDPCTADEVCDEVNDLCIVPEPPAPECLPALCDDDDPCTIEECVDTDGDGIEECVNTPVECDDDNPCTIDACVNGDCVYTDVDCDDGDPCTNDTCVDGECEHTPKCPVGMTCVAETGECIEREIGQPAPRRSVGCGIFSGVGLIALPLCLFAWSGLRSHGRRRGVR